MFFDQHKYVFFYLNFLFFFFFNLKHGAAKTKNKKKVKKGSMKYIKIQVSCENYSSLQVKEKIEGDLNEV